MRALLFSVVLAFAGLRAAQAPQDGTTVTGQVVRQETSAPIPDVQIMLAQLNPSLPQDSETMRYVQGLVGLMRSPLATRPGFLEGFVFPQARKLGIAPEVFRPTSVFTAVSDSAGAFTFKGVLPGRYTLIAQLEGYFAPRIRGTADTLVRQVVVIEANKPVPRQKLLMNKGGLIGGHVRDTEGKVTGGVIVEAIELQYPAGKPTLSSQKSVTTDDRGEFRLFWLPPGDYLVAIRPNLPGATPAPQDSWERTFFPGVADPASAAPFKVADGGEVTNIDLDVRTVATSTYKISGIAINAAAAPGRGGVVDRSISRFYLMPRQSSLLATEETLEFQNTIPASSRPNGEFEIRKVKPGDYDLYAIANGGLDGLETSLFRTARTRVVIRNADVSGLVLSVGAGATLEAQISSNALGTSSPLNLGLVALDFTPRQFLMYSGALRFDAESKLRAPGFPEGRFGLTLDGLPNGTFISDIKQDGRSVFDEGIVLGQEVKPIQIVINAGGGVVAGLVQTADRKPAGNATVVLVPPASRRKNALLFKTAVTDETGHFTISGIMPGTYAILALKDHPAREPWMNESFLMKYEQRSRLLNISAGSDADVSLELAQ